MLTDRLDRTTALAALALANRAPSVHNSQPWRWRVGRSTVHLFADPARALPGTDPEGRDLVLSCGAALHHLRVALLAAGTGTHVHRLPDPAHPTHLAAVEVFHAVPAPEDLALAGAIERRASDRRVFSTWPVPEEHRAELVAAAEAHGATLRTLESSRELRAVAMLAEHAAVQQALLPQVAVEVAAWTGRSRYAEAGVPASNVPAAPGGSVPVRHVAAARQAQSRLGRDETDGTVVALLSTAGDTPADRLRAGEALSAVLLTATGLGLATDPISQPLEIEDTRAELRRICLGDRADPQVLVRVGWAPVSSDPVPRTGRRPVAETVDPFEAPWP